MLQKFQSGHQIPVHLGINLDMMVQLEVPFHIGIKSVSESATWYDAPTQEVKETTDPL